MAEDKGLEDEFAAFLIQLFKNMQLLQDELDSFTPMTINDDISENEIWEGIEDRFSQWMSSFYGILVYLLSNVISFVISLVNPVFTFLPVVLMVIFPFYSWGVFLYSIPEITIDGKVIFSRKDLSLTLQFKIARAMFEFFVKQMYRHNKYGIMVFTFFILFLVIVIVDRFWWHIAY